MLLTPSIVLHVVYDRHITHRYCDRREGAVEDSSAPVAKPRMSAHRLGPPVAVALVVLTGCGGSVWSEGFQRAISVIPGVEVAGNLPAEDAALRPEYQVPEGELAAGVEAAGAPAAEPAPAMEAPAGQNLLIAEAALDNSLLGRMQRTEVGLLRLEAEFESLHPSIERLVAIEADLDELVAQLFLFVAQGSPSPASPSPDMPAAPAVAALPAPAEPVGQPADGAPIALIPAGDGGVPAPREEPAMAAVGGAEQFALHLASYRERDNAVAGWEEFRLTVPDQLADLRPGTSIFDKGADGQFIRLKAGPLASKSEAESRCEIIRAVGLYCAVMPYAGTSPL